MDMCNVDGSADGPGEPDESSEPLASETRSGASPPGNPPHGFNEVRPVLEPVTDSVTVELVRDAIGVARGEVSDERFAQKYEMTAGQSDTVADTTGGSE